MAFSVRHQVAVVNSRHTSTTPTYRGRRFMATKSESWLDNGTPPNPQVEVCQQPNGAFSVIATAWFESCSADTVFDVISDYPGKIRWIPGLQKVTVTCANPASNETTMEEVQRVSFLGFGRAFTSTVAATPNPTTRTITFVATSSQLFRDWRMRWTLTPHPTHTHTPRSNTVPPQDAYAPPDQGTQGGWKVATEPNGPGADVHGRQGVPGAVTEVRLEGVIDMKVSPPGPFTPLLCSTLAEDVRRSLVLLEEVVVACGQKTVRAAVPTLAAARAQQPQN